MFKDWYNDYLRMIYPRSVEDEFEYSWNKKVIEIETREVVAIIEAARFCLDLIQCKLLGSEQIVVYKGTRLNPDASNIRFAENYYNKRSIKFRVFECCLPNH